jgi:hypothetical protein
MDYTQYVKAELLVLIPVLIIIGVVLKKAEWIKDKYIPLILTVVSLVMSCLYVLGNEGISTVSVFTAITQGVLCTGGAVLANQYVKQAAKSE